MCGALSAQSKSWREMTAHLNLIYTEGVQIRLNKSLRDLGWTQPHRLLAMVEVSDLNTFADMPSQLRWESWPQVDSDKYQQELHPAANPKASLYFVSAMPTSAEKDPHQHLVDTTRKFLNSFFVDIFPDAASYKGTLYVVGQPGSDPVLFERQPDISGKLSGMICDPQWMVTWFNSADKSSSEIMLQSLKEVSPSIRIKRPDLGATLGAQWGEQNRCLLTWSNNGKAVVWQIDAIGDGSVPTPKFLTLSHTGPVFGAAWSPGYANILTWSMDSTACVWDVSTGIQQPTPLIIRHTGPVLGAAWSPDGECILTGCQDGAARIWRSKDLESPSPKPVLTLYHDAAVCGGFWHNWQDGSGQLLTWSDDHTARIWNVNDYRRTDSVVVRHKGPVVGAEWLSESELLTWSADKTARIWDPASPKKAKHILRHPSEVLGAACNPDTKRVLTWTDHTVNMWSAPYEERDPLIYSDGAGPALWNAASQALFATNQRQFDWNLLIHAPTDQETGEDLINTQFLTGNVRPSDKYVLTAVGTSKYRLGSHDTDFDNLYITGDWTKTPLSLGCMESAAMSGLLAARALTGRQVFIDGETDFELIPEITSAVPRQVATAMIDTSSDSYQILAQAIVIFLQGMRDEVQLGMLTQRSLLNLLLNGGNQMLNQLQQSVGGFDPRSLDFNRLTSLVLDEMRRNRAK
jgi:WD40 repeat protein